MSEIISFLNSPTYQYGMSAVGTGLSAFSKYQEGQAKKEAYDYDAKLALKKAGIEEKQIREKYSRLMGRRRSLYAKAGVDITSGSPLLDMAETAAMAEEEAMTKRSEGHTEAERLRMYGKISANTGLTSAMSTLFSGISSIGEKKPKKSGSVRLFDLSPGRSDW